mgnify:FL=1
MRKFIIKGVSKKFKGIQKIPAQKTPKFKSLTDTDIKLRQSKIADQNIRDTVGSDSFQNFSHRSLESLRAESIGSKISVRRFDRSLQSALKETRKITATGIKGKKLKVKQPTKPTFAQQSKGVIKGSSVPRSKPSLTKAKDKGAMKAYGIANTNAENSFQRTLRRFTDKTKVSSFKNRTAATKRPLSAFDGEQAQYNQSMRSMGFEPDAKPDFSGNLMTGSGKIKSYSKGKGPFSSLKNKRYEWKKKKWYG